VLESIEANNATLRAYAEQTARQKLEDKAGNNLPDPTATYAHMWGAGSRETISEASLSQRFDFPTLYAGRRKLNKLKANALDSQARTLRRDILLLAQELCLDIILLRQQRTVLEERLKNARELTAMYDEKLKQGEANVIQTNRISLELLNAVTEAGLNETALRNKLLELTALNGNIPVTFDDTDYPLPTALLPPDDPQAASQTLRDDPELAALHQQILAANRQLRISKAQWLPKLELGYRRNIEAGRPFNGLMAGISIPLFENRNNIKAAKAQTRELNARTESAAARIKTEQEQLRAEAQALQNTINDYKKTAATQTTLPLLKEALAGGQLSTIEYLAELTVFHQSRLNHLQLQNQYQKTLARLRKNGL
jgi:outer membrane protein TolC